MSFLPLRGSAVLLALAAAVSPMRGQVEEEPPTNLQVFQRLALEIGTDLSARITTQKIDGVTVFPREIGLTLEQDLVRGLAGSIVTAGGGDSTRGVLEFVITDARVELENTRRDGFFGPRIVDRVVTLAGRTKARPTGYYDVARTRCDTVRLSGVERLASPSLPFTLMAAPSHDFFDDLLEPLVVIGSVGVAVYLLFAVRS